MSDTQTTERPTTAKGVLQAARKLIERPEAWTKLSNARDQSGDGVNFSSADACAWCSMGALDRGAMMTGASFAERANALFYLHGVISPSPNRRRSVQNWNDAPERTHEEVLAAFDAAIAKAGG